MNIGEIIDNDKVGQREFDPNELMVAMRKGAFMTVASWGARGWMRNENLWLRFLVSGHHHKGYVYITLAWNDTFTLYFTNNRGKIVDKKEEVYIDELIEKIDVRVEKIGDYKW